MHIKYIKIYLHQINMVIKGAYALKISGSYDPWMRF